MNSFVFSYPTRVYFGIGSVDEAFSKEIGKIGDTVMLVYGGGSIKKSGIYSDVVALLEKYNKRVVEFSGIMPNPTYRKVQEGARLARKENVDFILAVGGGSVIDSAKIISVQALLDEDIYSLEYDKMSSPGKGISMGAIVTASGTGAEMNGGAVITYEEKNWKGALFGTVASFAILDPSYTLTVPRMQVFSGAFDTLSHAMETFMGNSDSDNVSDDLALAVMKNTVINMKRLLINFNDIEARSNLMWDSAMAENGILKCGRSTDFQVHQIEHQLGAYTDCNHGQALAVIQPVYYRYIVENAQDKLKRFARVVFDCDSAKEGLDALSAFIKECGLPTRLGELQCKTHITPELLRAVADSSNIIKTNSRELSRDEIYEILLQCL